MLLSIIKKEFKAITPSVGEVCDFIKDNIPSALSIDNDSLDDLLLAIDEAASNIVLHALRNNRNMKYRVVVSFSTDRVDVSFFDKGRSFDLNSIPKPDLSTDINTRQIGGLGIFIMKKFLDRLDYIAKNSDHPENEMKLTKFVHPKLNTCG